MSRTLHAFGLGVASENANGDILDVFFPAPKANISGGLADALHDVSGTLDDASLSSVVTSSSAVGDD